MFYVHVYNMWPATWKPAIGDLCAISAMHVFSTWDQYLSIFSFCHVRIKKSFFYLLPSLTKAKRKLLSQNKPFLASVLIYLVSTAARARNPLLWVLIRIRSSWLFRWGYIRLSTEQRCTFHIQGEKVAMAKVDPPIFAFTSDDSAFIEITS